MGGAMVVGEVPGVMNQVRGLGILQRRLWSAQLMFDVRLNLSDARDETLVLVL